VKLDIGSGDFPFEEEGWTTVDAYYEDADCKAWAWDLPYESDSVEELRASHVLEHIPRPLTQRTLFEWFRVLCPGGLITIEVPDMDWMARKWLETDNGFDLDWAEECIYGAGGHMGNFHRTAWNEIRLHWAFVKTGFEEPVIKRDVFPRGKHLETQPGQHQLEALIATANKP